jgi:carboxyl-terminal processing protease
MDDAFESEEFFDKEEEHTREHEAASSSPRRRGFTRVLRTGIFTALVLALGFIGGLTVGASGNESKVFANVPLIGDGLDATPDPALDFNDFWKVYNVLQQRFVQTHGTSTPNTPQQHVYGAIQGLVASYGDPYTVFFPPEQAKAFQDNIAGNFSGVGMEIGVNTDGILAVIAPLKGTPADKAGIKPGDLILYIDGKSTEGMSTDEAVKQIRGPKGTKVTFTIARGTETLKIPVVRDTIQVPTIDNSYDASTGVYTIALYEFTANSGELFDKAFADFQKSGSRKLIIDLRGNPGGYLDQAVQMASHFLPEGSVVVTEDYEGKGENIVHRSTGTGGLPAGTKVVILIDQGSASASEIFSGTLQDNKLATLVGARSFGKGSVQELVSVGKASLKVTVARWLTPSGRSISNGGLTPDIKVENTASSTDATSVKGGAAGSTGSNAKPKDVQKERAIQFLTTGR